MTESVFSRFQPAGSCRLTCPLVPFSLGKEPALLFRLLLVVFAIGAEHWRPRGVGGRICGCPMDAGIAGGWWFDGSCLHSRPCVRAKKEVGGNELPDRGAIASHFCKQCDGVEVTLAAPLCGQLTAKGGLAFFNNFPSRYGKPYFAVPPGLMGVFGCSGVRWSRDICRPRHVLWPGNCRTGRLNRVWGRERRYKQIQDRTRTDLECICNRRGLRLFRESAERLPVWILETESWLR